MNRKLEKCLSLLLTFLLVFGLMTAAPPPVKAATETLAEWTLTGALDPSPGTPATGGLYQEDSFLASTAVYSGFTAGNGTVYYNNWSVGGYWEIQTSTSGFSGLELKYASYGSNTGPKNFAAFYSLDGESFAKIEGSDYSLTFTATSGTAQNISIALPYEAEDADVLWLRLQVEDNASINDGTMAGAGTSRIGTVSLIGGVEPGGGDPGEPGPGDGGDPGKPDDPVMTIAEARAQGAGSVEVEGFVTRALQSSGTNTTNCTLYIQDDTAGIAVFASGITLSTFEVGAKVRVAGTLSLYNGVLQIQPANLSAIEVLPTSAAPVMPETISISQLNSLAYEGRLVKVEGVKLAAIATNSNHSIIDIADGASATLRCTAGTTLPAEFAVDDMIDVVGVAANFNGGAQLMVSVFGDITPGEEPPPPDTTGTDGYGVAAQWNLSAASGTEIAATDGDCMAGATLQFIKNGVPQILNFSSGGANLSGLNGTANESWWLITASSAGFKNIEVCWNMRSSATGPRDFTLQYSANGIEWFDANDPDVIVPSAVAIGATNYSKTLPVGANNLDELYLRLLMTSETSAGGATIGSGGTHQINYITVNGDYILGENQLSRPVADPAGGAVPVGQAVAFTPGSEDDGAVEGYAIHVSDDGGNTWAAAAGNEYTAVSLPLTLLVKAAAPGKDDSRVNTYEYTQAKLPLVTASKNSGPVIPGSTIKLENAVAGASIKYTLNGGAELLYAEALTLSEEMFAGDPARVAITAWAEKDGYITGDKVTLTYTIAVAGGEKVYFGQIHSHTNLSDGIGEIEEAYRYARDVAGLDFFAVTDHSNSFGEPTAQSGDNPAGIDLNNYNLDNVNWQKGQNAATNAFRAGEFISFYGYEMTWSGGPGHMNTFNTSGFVSRNNTALNNKQSDAGMRAYYELLSRTPDSITMFNHPGTTFGNFSNFAYYDPIIDQRVTLLEVGNGEGAIGSGGYFPSYEQYTMALDKGWHVAPTNSQDNHLGKWGNANTARVGIWTNDLSLDGVYQALRDMRVYSTEVADLEIVYKVNGQPLGTILDIVPSSADFTAEIVNPTAGNYVKSVCLVTNGGVELLKDTPNAQDYNYTKTIDHPAAGYYYLRVVVSTPQGDRIAVTAPVWLGQGKAAGFAEVTKDKIMPVTGESIGLASTIFNNEQQAATLTSIKYEARGAVLDERSGLTIVIAPNSEYIDELAYTPTAAGETTVDVTAVLKFADGTELSYSYSITFDVWDAQGLVYIGVDGAHYNEYVSGNYKDNMTNFADVAASYGVRVNILNTEEELIAAAGNPQYRALLLTAPSRRLYPNIPGNPAGLPAYRSYSPEVRDAITAFAGRGGTTIFTGWSNIYEGGYTDTYGTLAGMPYDDLMFAQQNKLLAAIGSTLRIAQDGAADSLTPYWPGVANAPNRLYPAGGHNAYNFSNPLMKTVDIGQRFSQYGGTTVFAVAPENSNWWNAPAAAVLPGSVSKVVSLPEGCRSEDYDIVHPNSEAYPRVPSRMYDEQFMIMASETVDHGNGVTSQVIVAGGAFMSNFEIRNSSVDNISDLYSNQNIVMNLIQSIMEVTPIAEVAAKGEGAIVTIEGIATTNVYSGDGATNTGFFDCIYVQDATGGINLFPVSAGVLEGQRIRVTGTVSAYQGETQIAVRKLDVIETSASEIRAKRLSTEAAMDPAYTGQLIRVAGTVSDVRETGGVISQFTVTDSSGVGALVYINAYITTDVDLSFVEDGVKVFVTGLASVGETMSGTPLPRLRIRDRGEIAPAPVFINDPGEVQEEGENAEFVATADYLDLDAVFLFIDHVPYELTLEPDGDKYLLYNDELYGAEALGEAYEGSIHIVLYEAFLATLSDGEYIVKISLIAEDDTEPYAEPEISFVIGQAGGTDPEPILVGAAATAKDFIGIKETNKNSKVWILSFTVTEVYADGEKKSVPYAVEISANNANVDGKIDLGAYTLYYDIKGNGSNIKEFRIVMNGE